MMGTTFSDVDVSTVVDLRAPDRLIQSIRRMEHDERGVHAHVLEPDLLLFCVHALIVRWTVMKCYLYLIDRTTLSSRPMSLSTGCRGILCIPQQYGRRYFSICFQFKVDNSNRKHSQRHHDNEKQSSLSIVMIPLNPFVPFVLLAMTSICMPSIGNFLSFNSAMNCGTLC